MKEACPCCGYRSHLERLDPHGCRRAGWCPSRRAQFSGLRLSTDHTAGPRPHRCTVSTHHTVKSFSSWVQWVFHDSFRGRSSGGSASVFVPTGTVPFYTTQHSQVSPTVSHTQIMHFCHKDSFWAFPGNGLQTRDLSP